MTMSSKSILVISPDAEITAAIGGSLAAEHQIKVDTKNATLSQLNGSAVELASKYDIVLFETSPHDPSEMQAIRTLAHSRNKGSVLVALADGGISLSQARELNKAGVDEVLPISGLDKDFGAQISKFGRQSQHVAPTASAQGKIIAVAQARGGVGSTTVAVNLADQLAGKVKTRKNAQKSKVALVDFDLQFGTVGSYLDLDEQDTLLQIALDGTIPDAEILGQAMVTMPNGLSVLAAPSKFAPLDSLRIDQVAAILETLQQTHDYVVVDMPRALVGWIEAVVERASELVIVTDISVSSVRHCRRLIDFFTTDNVALPVKIVVNGEKKPLIQKSLHREAAKALERKLDTWLPNDPVAAHAAADRGKPLSAAAPRSQLSKAMAKFAAETKTFTKNMPLGAHK